MGKHFIDPKSSEFCPFFKFFLNDHLQAESLSSGHSWLTVATLVPSFPSFSGGSTSLRIGDCRSSRCILWSVHYCHIWAWQFLYFFCCRCIAVSSLGMYLYEELKHGTMHSRIKEAIHTLLLTLRVSAHVTTNWFEDVSWHVSVLLTPQLFVVLVIGYWAPSLTVLGLETTSIIMMWMICFGKLSFTTWYRYSLESSWSDRLMIQLFLWFR
jgi:hypothetical protein